MFTLFLQIRHAEDNLDITDEKSGFLLTVMAVSGAVSTTIVGLLSDRIAFTGKILVVQALLLLGGISTALLPFYQTYELLAIYMIIQGLSMGFTTLIPVISVAIVGEEHCTITVGLVFFYQITAVFGPLIAGPSICLSVIIPEFRSYWRRFSIVLERSRVIQKLFK